MTPSRLTSFCRLLQEGSPGLLLTTLSLRRRLEAFPHERVHDRGEKVSSELAYIRYT